VRTWGQRETKAAVAVSIRRRRLPGAAWSASMPGDHAVGLGMEKVWPVGRPKRSSAALSSGSGPVNLFQYSKYFLIEFK
jgi:hypothetical protein